MRESEDPLISVVLPVYNGVRWLPETLAGVLGQEGTDSLEVVAIDDGSADDSAKIISAIGDPRVRITRRENRGISATRNEAIRRARGRFIAFIDQDDLWRSDKLARQLPRFDMRPEAGLVHCQCARVDESARPINGGPLVSRDRPSEREIRRLRRRSRGSIHGYCATWLIRTGRYRAAGSDLFRACRDCPSKPRYLVLLFFSLLGLVPGPVRRRLI